jgi:hypothetical protein
MKELTLNLFNLKGTKVPIALMTLVSRPTGRLLPKLGASSVKPLKI